MILHKTITYVRFVRCFPICRPTRLHNAVALLLVLLAACNGSGDGNIPAGPGQKPGSNNAPVAVNDSATTQQDRLVVIDVLANDSDADGDVVAITNLTTAANGQVAVVDSGTPNDPGDDLLHYTPDPGYTGPDQFDYTITDGVADDTATVSVTVSATGVSTRTVSGQVLKGPLAGARVELYPVDGTGQRAAAQPLAVALTAADGSFTAEIPAAAGGLLIEATGGTYADEASGENGTSPVVQLGPTDMLAGLLPDGGDFAVVSVYTNAILMKSRVEVGQNNFEAVFANNRALFEQAFGFDLVGTVSADPAAPDPLAAVETRRHAMTLGGAANALAKLAVDFFGTPAPTFPMIDALIRDMSDCRLDNQDLNGPIVVDIGNGPQTLAANLDLNTEIARFRNNHFDDYSNTPLVVVDQSVCSQSGQAPDPDVDPPVFSSVPSPFTVGATGPTGIAASDPFVQQKLASVQATDDSGDPVVITDDAPAIFPPGATVITFVATDSSGNEAFATVSVTVIQDTTPPTVTAPPDVDQFATGPVTGVDPGVPVVSDDVDTPITTNVTVNPPVANFQFPVGAYTASWTASDVTGNVSPPVLQSIVVRNNTPTVAGPAAQTMDENQTLGPLSFGIGDVETATNVLSVAAVADNANLFPAAGIVIGGSGTTRTLTLTPAANTSGSATITIEVTDEHGAIGRASFDVTVQALNTPPTFTLSGDLVLDEDFSGTRTVTVTPDPVPPSEAGQVVVYSISPPVSFANVSINPSTGTVSVTAVPDGFGSQLMIMTADDQQAANNTATQSFALIVNPQPN